ncbi:WD40 repeat domain-containing protein [Bremerella sp. JC817]|uniref:WD40 repeat domain-containing protein n=1 Tax=Bremerella sp. JC817 TaxID=3231756 RepID=UPI0034581FE0
MAHTTTIAKRGRLLALFACLCVPGLFAGCEGESLIDDPSTPPAPSASSPPPLNPQPPGTEPATTPSTTTPPPMAEPGTAQTPAAQTPGSTPAPNSLPVDTPPPPMGLGPSPVTPAPAMTPSGAPGASAPPAATPPAPALSPMAPGTTDVSALRSKLLGFWAPEKDPNSGFQPPILEIGEEEFSIAGGESGPYQLLDATTPARIILDGGHEKMHALVDLNGDTLRLSMLDPREHQGDFPKSMNDKRGMQLTFRRGESPPRSIAHFGLSVRGVYYQAGTLRPDGKAVAMRLGNQLLVWDLENQRKVTRLSSLNCGEIGQMSWSPDGKWLGVASQYALPNIDGGYVMDVDTMKPLATFEKECAYVVFSPDGRFFATGGREVNPKLWSTTSGKPVIELKTQANRSEAGAISPNSKWLATYGHGSDTIELFETQSGKKLAELPLKKDQQVSRICFAPDNRSVYALTTNEEPGVWKFALDSKQPMPQRIHETEYDDMAFSADGSVFVASAEEVLEVREDPDARDPTETFALAIDGTTIDVSRDGRLLLGASKGRCEVFDRKATSDEKAVRWPGRLSEEQDAIFTQDSKFFDMSYTLVGEDRNIMQDGNPVLSWRVRVFDRYDASVEHELAPWDSQENKALLETPPKLFRLDKPEDNKAYALHVTGPGTVRDPNGISTQEGDPHTIRFVLVGPESGVPWTAPQDFVFDPNDPWKGLPKEGFYANLTSSYSVWVRGDTPPDVLKAMFTINGKEKVDINKWTEIVTVRFAYGPEETNALPPFSPN